MGIDPNIDPNIGPIGPIVPVGGPVEEEEETVVFDPLKSSLSTSQQEALMVLWLMNMPILPRPQGEGFTVDGAAIAAIGAAKIAEIGSNVWDKYLDYLEEQKERIREYLTSPRYEQWLEARSPSYLAKVERDTPLNTKNAIRSSTEYNMWLQSLPPADREEEVNRNRALDIWSNLIDATSTFIGNYRDETPDTIPALAVGFVIMSTFIGDYMNIIDVASTDLVLVNPIQDAATSVVPILPPDFQEQVVLAINLFAIGMVYTTALDEVAKSMKSGGETPKDLEFAKTFANNVINKVKSNEVNYFLMALLVNTLEEGAPVTDERINQLATIAKVVMLAIALAVLYKVETGWIKGQEFRDMVEGKMDPRTDEESILVNMFAELRAEGLLPEESWDNLMEALVGFFEGNPSIEDILNPMKAYISILGRLTLPEHKG